MFVCVREVEKLSFYGSGEHNRKRLGVVVWSPVPDNSECSGHVNTSGRSRTVSVLVICQILYRCNNYLVLR